MNTQEPESKKITVIGNSSETFLEIHSIFPTIQGEGPLVGYPALFIRLAGCNLQCPLCDTDYTSNRDCLAVSEILHQVNEAFNEIPGKLVVITGGEPFRQQIGPLVEALLYFDYDVQIETNGTIYQPLPFNDKNLVVVCSPKTGSVHSSLLPHIKALKYVGTANSLSEEDGLPLWALDHPAAPHLFRAPLSHQLVYLQPADEKDPVKNQKNLEAVVKSCLKHGHILCLQIHKSIGVE
jgi:7-carboxy-7-deazaguanine synthase